MSAAAAMRLALAIATSEPAPCPTPDACRPLHGTVRRAAERTPLPEVVVTVLPATAGADIGRVRGEPVPAHPEWSVRLVTDDRGNFVTDAIPRGRVRLVAVADGYVREDRIVDAREERPVRLYLRPDDSGYRTVVNADTDADDADPVAVNVVEHTLKHEELRTIPGAGTDALRGAQALPGFARVPFGLGLVVLRGAPPSESIVMLGEHPVPRAFHTLPLVAILPSDAIESLSIVPSNYSARYGPGTGGLVRIDPAQGRRDGHHGFAQADVFTAGALQQGPVGDGSYLVGARHGHVGAVLGLVERIDDSLGYPKPRLWDYQATSGGPIARGLELRAAVYGAGDSVVHDDRFCVGGACGGELFSYRGQMHRPSLTLIGSTGRTRVLASAAFLAAKDEFELPEVEQVTRLDLQPSWRFEIQHRVHRIATMLLGSDGAVARYRGTLTTFSPGMGMDGERILVADESGARGTESNMAIFGLVELSGGPVRVVPGTRVQVFSIREHSRAALDPRLAIEIEIGERWRLLAAAGGFSQPYAFDRTRESNFINGALGPWASRVILPPALLENFEPRIPVEEDGSDDGLGIRRAWHVSGGAEVDLPWASSVSATAFARWHWIPPIDIVAPGAESSVELESERGRDVGGELLVRKRLTRRFYGWVAYTLMKSTADLGGESHPGDFDQRHTLSVVASYGLPRRVRIGARFRLVSGTPYTPIAAVIDVPDPADPLDTSPGRIFFGPENSARLPLFHQLDIRVDKEWLLSHLAIAFYADVQNVYNHNNPEFYIYEWDFTTAAGSYGLPILPSLGLRIAW